MKRPIESDYTSHVAYTRALEMHCDTLTKPAQRTWIWLSDADIRESIDSICQYTGDFDEWLAKKIERKVKALNT
jgi:hypothetical protein